MNLHNKTIGFIKKIQLIQIKVSLNESNNFNIELK